MGEPVWNEVELLLLGNWGPGAIAVFIALALTALGVTWLDVRELPRRRSATLIGLRMLTLGAAIMLLLEPAIEKRQVTRVPNHVAVLVDVSRSQELPSGREGDGEVTRWDRVQTALADLAERAANSGTDHTWEFWALDGDLQPSTAHDLLDPARRPVGDDSDIGGAIELLNDRYAPGELGAVILVSDGTDLGPLGRQVLDDGPLDPALTTTLGALGAPIHTLATADAGTIRDVAIRRVRHDDFAFVRNAVEVEAELTVLGYSDAELQVILRRGGVVLQTRTVQLAPGQSEYRVGFEFVPELLGREIYSVEVSLLDGEALTANNTEFFVLRVVRDRIRVLQVVGAPSWDVRFLRQFLKGDPNVDLISFFILRGNEDVNRAPNSEMSLIPFPTDRLFGEELPGFDLVIFQNFDFGPYQMQQYLDDVRDYVQGGGGFAMLGGARSFASGGYATTEIAEVLPVDLPTGRDPAALLDLAAFRPQLTDAGRRHPISRLEFDRGQNEARWASLPELHGVNVVLGADDDATVLLEHPGLEAGGAPMPVLTVAQRGEGRVMAFTSDEAWRWSFDAVGEQGTSRAFSSFWNNAIRWLIRDPELNLVQTDVDELVYPPGADVTVDVRAFEVDYAPAANARGHWRVVRRDLGALATADEEVVAEADFTTDEAGRTSIAIAGVVEGAWRVDVWVGDAEDAERRDSELFLVVPTSRELRYLEPRAPLLQLLSATTGGRHVSLAGGRLGDLPILPAAIEQVGRREVLDVWSNPWVLLLFALTLGAEWALRRRWGRF